MFYARDTSRITPWPGRISVKVVALALTALGVLATALPVAGVMSPEERVRFQCIGCHTGSVKVYINPVTGQKKEIQIDLSRIQLADHAEVPCQDCHVKGFDTFPHFGKKIKGCMDCHPRKGAGAQEDAPYDFPRIEKEFKRTVHFTKHRKEFNCAQCHHPHYFKATARLGPPKKVLEVHNQWCLNCHSANPKQPPNTIEGWPELADPAKPSLVAEHALIPHPTQHLRKVRCLDCHSGADHVVSHALPLGEQAPGCNSCHTRDSVQERLYRYVKHVQDRQGFTNTAILNDSYVMGATRYVPLDILAYVLVGGPLLAAAGQGIMRLVRRIRSKASDSEQGYD